MTVDKVFLSLKREIRVIIISVLSFVLLSSMITFFIIKPKYESVSKVYIGKEKFINTSEDYTNEEVVMYQMMIKTYTELLKTRDLSKSVLSNVEEDISIEEALGKVQFTPITDTQILEIKYISNSKSEVYNLAYGFTKEFVDASKKLYPNVNVQVIEQPKVPVNKISPNNLINISVGGILGLAFGITFVLLKEYLDKTIRSKEDLEDLLGIATLGVIPSFKE